jgi:glycosyltransferase involved in cell wall biosynthesis
MSGPAVILVTPGFPPTRGGVEEHVRGLADELAEAGAEVTVLTSRRGVATVQRDERRGYPVWVYPAWRTAIMSISPRLLWAGLRCGENADVVHVHSYHAMTAAAVLNRRARGRIVFTPHYHGGGHTPLAVALHLVYRRFAARLFRAAAQVICVSEAERQALVRDFPGVADRVSVIPNGVATAAVRAAQPYPDEPPTLLSLGRLEPYKGIEQLLRALPRVSSTAQLVVIGEGSDRSRLEALTAELGLTGRVRFRGAVETDEVHRWLRTAQVLVSVSEHEAFGMAPLEAADAGARVVLSDIPAHREIAAQYLAEVAVVVDRSDVDQLAAAINHQLASSEPAVVSVPSWGDVARRTLAVYQAIPTRHIPSESGTP